MTPEQIIKKLQKEKSHNPFHKDYDWGSVLKTVEESGIKNNERDANLNIAVYSCLVTGLISPFFDETYTEVKKRIEASSLSTLQIIRFLIVHVNRNYLLLKKQFQSNLGKSNQIDYLDSYRFQIESLDPKIGEVQASASLEGEIDTLNVLFNYLRYFEGVSFKKKNSRVTELESISSILAMSFVGTYFNLVKTCYEDAIWNRGYIYVENESKSIKIDYHSHEEQKLLKVGQIRLSRNSTGTYFNLIELNKNNDFTSPFSQYKKRKRIKQIFIINGIVTYKLAKGIDKKEADHEIKLLSELNTYYPFIGNEDFPKFKDLNLNKFLAMFSSLQYLFRRIAEINIGNDEIMKINDFNKFPHRIKIATLKDFFINKFHFSNAQIKDFLSLLEVNFDNSSRVNLWDRPLIDIFTI